jgi:hypothetical protein
MGGPGTLVERIKMKQTVEPVIEVYFNPNEARDGVVGCFCSRLRNDHELHDAGTTPELAVKRLVQNVGCFANYEEDGELKFAHLPATVDDYEIVRLDSRTLKPMSGPWNLEEPDHLRQVEDARKAAAIVHAMVGSH